MLHVYSESHLRPKTHYLGDFRRRRRSKRRSNVFLRPDLSIDVSRSGFGRCLPSLTFRGPLLRFGEDLGTMSSVSVILWDTAVHIDSLCSLWLNKTCRSVEVVCIPKNINLIKSLFQCNDIYVCTVAGPTCLKSGWHRFFWSIRRAQSWASWDGKEVGD